MELNVIAHVESDFPEKFGIPRQSGLSENTGRIVFEPEYRDASAFRGLDGYSHIWVLWGFSEEFCSRRPDGRSARWSPTVHPPRLGGNTRMGVFATRSPNRPNPIGLSSVRLNAVEHDSALGPVLRITGADIMDGTPVYDIKPYLAYTDCHTDAVCGFSDDVMDYKLDVVFPDELLALIPAKKRAALISVLEQDPRPSYHEDETRVYGTAFADKNIKFRVKNKTLTVCGIEDYAEFLKRI